MQGINVLSLCDGMSCGHLALDKVGIKVNKYFAAEIKEVAINLVKEKYPETIHVGDVNRISYKDGVLYTENGEYSIKFDLVIFGSPCQSFSRAMIKERKIGLEDRVRSGLFLECYRILKEVNPKYFLMENVIMTPENEEVVSSLLGIRPIRINSSLVSGQLRDRLYWTNIGAKPFGLLKNLRCSIPLPKDKNINVNDIIDEGYVPFDKARCLMKNDSHGYYNGCNWTPIARFHRAIYKNFGTMVFPSKETYETCKKITDGILKGRDSRAEFFEGYQGHEFDCLRYLTKEERARLQTVPEEYVSSLSEKDAADLLGDGWTIDVIAHIFSYMRFD